MRLYSGSSEQFITDTTQNLIAQKMKDAFFDYFRYYPSHNEMSSWQNSLRSVKDVMQASDLRDHGVILEYQLPLTSRRLDCMVTGKNCDGTDNAVVVELKQWDRCEEAPGDNEVVTWLGGAKREVLHPSVQVGQYHMYLQDTHTEFYEKPDPIGLSSCTYLHNYIPESDDVILSRKFREVMSRFPLFTGDKFNSLCDFMRSRMSGGEGLSVLRRVTDGKYRPSKKLMEHVGGVIKGRPEYILLDEQLIIFDKILACAREGFHDRRKAVIVVRGGPGTGKSVIAINVMADLLLKGYNAQYATGSRAFTETLRAVIGQRGSVQFKYFNSYQETEVNEVDVLICDEAHRLREYSYSRFTPKHKRSKRPQIDEIMRAAKVSVFFIDDDQVVRQDEIGTSDYIKQHALDRGCEIAEYELEAQFRCCGSEGFVNWVNNTLQIKRTANVIWDPRSEEFDFRIYDSPNAVEEAIKQRIEQGHTGRVVAGFCWPWSKDTRPDGMLYDDVVIEDYVRPWNARPEARCLAPEIPKATLWAHEPNGIYQVGCVYTAQGFEFDYVGVIFGLDLVYDFDRQGWVGRRSESCDHVVKRSKEKFVDLVKNTYRVLLSRGLKGCYAYFMDKDTERFFRSRMEGIRT